jgi:hypothetical protein
MIHTHKFFKNIFLKFLKNYFLQFLFQTVKNLFWVIQKYTIENIVKIIENIVYYFKDIK